MDMASISDITGEALRIGLMISAPMLLGSLLIGIIVSIFQAVTQINEQTLTFIPKIIVIIAALAMGAPWMSDKMSNFTRNLILNIPQYVTGR